MDKGLYSFKTFKVAMGFMRYVYSMGMRTDVLWYNEMPINTANSDKPFQLTVV